MKKLLGVIGALAMLFGLVACSSGDSSPVSNTPTGEPTATIQVVNYASRGEQITATLVLPAGVGPFPLVIMAHGHGGTREEHSGFAAIAEALQLRGIASIRMDFPGCGDSTESFRQNTLTNMKADVMAVFSFLTSYPVDLERVGIFGYSMGGRVALELLADQSVNENFNAAAFLAPAASTEDLKRSFGGVEAWDELKAVAYAEGYATFTTVHNQVQELSREWFTDMEVYTNPENVAASAFSGRPMLVAYADDDGTVSPAVSRSVADALQAQVINASGDGHSFGFHSERVDLREIVANGVADFFATNL